jgi:hypothetical protein
MDEAWAFEHSVECPVTAEFAWRFWTDTETWRLDEDVEAVERNGPFAAGTSGATITRSSGRVEWRIVSVREGSEALIEAPVPGAVARFQWTFEDLGGLTRITQRISLAGEGAAALAHQMASIFEPNMPAGMRKLCDAMAKSAKERSPADD